MVISDPYYTYKYLKYILFKTDINRYIHINNAN